MRGEVPVVVGRDRVLDAVRAFALLSVVFIHAAAWDLSSGTVASALDVRPDVVWATWLLQVVPLFFTAGGATNLLSWGRHPDVADYLRRRVLRLGAPGLVYAGTWTAVLLPLALVPVLADDAVVAGRFLAQLLWFLGVYALVTTAVPWTSRWAVRPALTVSAWLAAIVAVDAARWNLHPGLGWLNLLLVWGFLHQLGYHLPAMRAAGMRRTLPLAAVSLAAAVALAVAGPYSTALTTRAGDPEPSNLSPPTLVIALYGTALALAVAAAWPALHRALSHDRAYLAVAAFGARAVGVYLWHIPVMTVAVGLVWLLGAAPRPFGVGWWALHLTVFAVVLAVALPLAGLAGRVDAAARARAATWARRSVPALPCAVGVGAGLLAMNLIGFGTWWGGSQIGLWSSALLNLAVLAGSLWGLAVGGSPAPGAVPVAPSVDAES